VLTQKGFVLYADTMHLPSLSTGVSALAVLGAIINAVLGLRSGHCDAASAFSRFVVASVALVIAVLAVVRVASPAVAYGMLCVAFVSSYLFDQFREERVRRRRVASLTPRPEAEAVPTVWVAIAVASVLMLAPYVILGEQRAAALMVGICALVIAGIAWRIASAPVQLTGADIRSERMRDRASRILRTGVSATVAIGSVFFFISFVNSSLAAVLPLQGILRNVSFVAWSGLMAWVMLYWFYLGRQSCPAP
jgi:hypothetical protein